MSDPNTSEGSLAIESKLLALPAEIRWKIWSFCIPDVLDIHLCPERSPESLRPPPSAPLAKVFQQWLQMYTLVSDMGLNLRLLNRQIRSESLPIFAQKTVHFCCKSCLNAFLIHLRETRIGCYWMRDVEVAVDLTRRYSPTFGLSTGSNTQRIGAWAREMREIQSMVHGFYGRLDLMEREAWRVLPMEGNKCVVSGMFDV